MPLGLHLDVSYANATPLDPDLDTVRKTSADYREILLSLSRLLERLASGDDQGAVVNLGIAGTAPVFASGTATCASVIAGNTIVVGGTTLTAVANASTPTNVQFRIGSGGGAAQNQECARNIAQAINDNPTINKLVFATVPAGSAVVTITAQVPGPVGNLITTTQVGGTITLSGATLANGDGTNAPNYSLAGVAQPIPFNPATGVGRISFSTP